MDRRNIQLAANGLGMGRDRREGGFPKFRTTSVQQFQATIRVALHHDRSGLKVQMESTKLRRTKALRVRGAGWTYR